MNNLLTWLLESGISLAFFYIAYKLFLERSATFQSNRLYLLGAILFSLLIPLLKFQAPVQTIHYSYFLPEASVTVLPEASATTQSNTYTGIPPFWILYGFVTVLFLIRLIIRFIVLLGKIYKGKPLHRGTVTLIEIPEDFPPFSFFNRIVINSRDLENKDLDKIIRHEEVHIRQLHTLDVFLAELLLVIQWFNPFVWMYRQSIKQLHEYLADREVLRKGVPIPEYQGILMSFQKTLREFTLANNFNYSLTKKRFIMMTKGSPGFFSRIRLFFVIPMIGLLLVSFIKVRNEQSIISKTLEIQYDQAYHGNDLQYGLLENSESENNALTNLGKTGSPPPEEAKTEAGERAIQKPEPPRFTHDDASGEKFRKYIADHLVYPQEARDNKIQGRLFVQFVVTKDGEIKNAKVIRFVNLFDGSVSDVETLSDGYEFLAAEAIRVIESSPNWIPGTYDGKVSDSEMVVPIAFQLQEGITHKDIAEEIFIIVEEMPRFGDGPDGPVNFRNYIAENLVYPPEAAKQGIQGLVFVQFTVNSKGFVENVKIVRGIHELLDAEAIRVVMESPQWTPGRQRGKEVNVQYTFPINFVLGDSKTE